MGIVLQEDPQKFLLQFKEGVMEYLLDGDDRRVINNLKRRILEKAISDSGRIVQAEQ